MPRKNTDIEIVLTVVELNNTTGGQHRYLSALAESSPDIKVRSTYSDKYELEPPAVNEMAIATENYLRAQAANRRVDEASLRNPKNINKNIRTIDVYWYANKFKPDPVVQAAVQGLGSMGRTNVFDPNFVGNTGKE